MTTLAWAIVLTILGFMLFGLVVELCEEYDIDVRGKLKEWLKKVKDRLR